MANTGIKTVLTLRKYVDGIATSETKANTSGDADYIAPYEDLVDCPISNTTAPTTAPPEPITSFVVYGSSSSGNGFSTADDACIGADLAITLYNSSGETTPEGAWINNTVLHSDAGATTVYNGLNQYYTDGVGYSFQISTGGTISTRAICAAAPGNDPAVVTQSPSANGTDTLTMTGNVTVAGDPSFTSKGFIWAQGTGTPTLSDNVVTVAGTSLGQYTQQITGLTEGTQYSYIAFVIQSGVYFYGSVQTTITNLVGYYQLQDCNTLSTNFRTGQTIEEITLGNSDRVTAGGTTYIVVGSASAGTPSVGTVTDTGLQGCPATERYYNYSECDGGGVTGVAMWPSGTTLANGNSFYFGGECWSIGTETTTSGADFDLTGYTIYNSCAECNTANPTTTTAAPSTCHEVTYDSSVYSLDQNRYGIAYFDYQGVFTTATFNGMLASVNGSELIYYVCASTVSNDVWDVTNNVAVPQYNSSLSSFDSGTACDGFCSAP
jgi:hypothetical protein